MRQVLSCSPDKVETFTFLLVGGLRSPFFSFNWIAAQLYKNNNNNTRQRRVHSILKEMKDLTQDDSYQDFREKENFGY